MVVAFQGAQAAGCVKTIAFLIVWNRLDLPRLMADYLAETGDVEPILVDNASDYPPLLDYYEHTPHRVERMRRNWGNCVVWTSGLLDTYGLDGNFIVSDPDLDLSGIPKDFLHRLQAGLDRYPWACKCGFGLEISDVPDTEIGTLAKGWERINWTASLDGLYYDAPIDTTFCLCRSRLHDFRAVRTGRPYVARHVPWYYPPIPPDEQYYFQHIRRDFNYYSDRIRQQQEAARSA